METLRKNTDGFFCSSYDIASALLKLSGVTSEAYEELEKAVYHLENTALNEYNYDYFRVFYNVLLKITERSAAE